MKKLLSFAVLIITTLLHTSCKKNKVEPATTVVKSITGIFNTISSPLYGPQKNYTITLSYAYNFNSNNQLTQSTADSFNGLILSGSHSAQNFTYTNNQLTKINLSPSSNFTSTELIYNSKNQIIRENFYSANSTLVSNNQITYNSNGSIATLIINSTFQHYDPWTCVYNYTADGLLANIVITPNGNPAAGGTIFITGYSDECDFNPWVIGDLVPIGDFFPPVALAGMKRLPLSLNYVFADGTGGNTYTYKYTINNRRIDRMIRIYDHSNQDKTITNKDTYDFSFAY
jgi:hypothetical protein